MVLSETIDSVSALRDALAAEVEEARAVKQTLRTLDAEAIFRRATRRESFNAAFAAGQEQIARALRAAGDRLGLEEVSVASLAKTAPSEAAVLSRLFAEIRFLASALREADALNRRLSNRALACVRGYLGAVAPSPTAYDRRGLAPAASAEGGNRSWRA